LCLIKLLLCKRIVYVCMIKLLVCQILQHVSDSVVSCNLSTVALTQSNPHYHTKYDIMATCDTYTPILLYYMPHVTQIHPRSHTKFYLTLPIRRLRPSTYSIGGAIIDIQPNGTFSMQLPSTTKSSKHKSRNATRRGTKCEIYNTNTPKLSH